MESYSAGKWMKLDIFCNCQRTDKFQWLLRKNWHYLVKWNVCKFYSSETPLSPKHKECQHTCASRTLKKTSDRVPVVSIMHYTARLSGLSICVTFFCIKPI